jgi:hypothetical protein
VREQGGGGSRERQERAYSRVDPGIACRGSIQLIFLNEMVLNLREIFFSWSRPTSFQTECAENGTEPLDSI